MLKKIFDVLFNPQKNRAPGNYIIATIYDKIMPIDRGETYEDPLDDFLKSKGYGEVTGGGTLQFDTGEVEYCDIEIKLSYDIISRDEINEIIEKLEELGAPKGSSILVEQTEEKIFFGNKEGIGVYLDGVNLPANVYLECDSNIVLAKLKELSGDNSKIDRFWEGAKETALYYYSDSFEHMKNSIKSFIDTYPLCKNARIERIA